MKLFNDKEIFYILLHSLLFIFLKHLRLKYYVVVISHPVYIF